MPRRIVDLTKPLQSGGGDGHYVVREFERPDAGHTVHHRVEMDVAVGTHIVAPRRLARWGLAIGDLPAERFFGGGIAVRVDSDDAPTEIGTQQIRSLVEPRMQPRDIVLLTVGERAAEAPRLTQDAAQWLGFQTVKLVALDERLQLGTADNPESAQRALSAMLQHEVPVIVGLTNTAALSDQRLAVMALPAAAKNLDAWPVRVIALDPGPEPAPEEEEQSGADGAVAESADAPANPEEAGEP